MPNDPARAEFWKEFVVDRCDYPAPDRLRAHLAEAVFSDFCECGCNSFAVEVPPGVAPLAEARENPSSGYGAIHTADFKMADGRTLEIVLFANDSGNLVFVEVDCCANSYPVPDDITVEPKPFQMWTAKRLLPG
jgi:hypothetical protein